MPLMIIFHSLVNPCCLKISSDISLWHAGLAALHFGKKRAVNT